MIRVRHILYIGIALLLSSCSDEQEQWPLTAAQNQLIGRAVNFSASHAELFATRTTYNADGSFNEGDVMTIYRQYSEDNGQTFNTSTEAYRVYEYVPRKAAGTEIVLGNDWKPKKDALGSNSPGTTFTQTDADSLTWENGKTVRFRAWSRSNLSNAINNKSKNTYYPDYCVSDWVTVSGPTEAVSLTMKHQGCRIAFTTKAGNELIRAEICTEVEDYMRPDNSTDYAHDESAAEHGKTREQAQAGSATKSAGSPDTDGKRQPGRRLRLPKLNKTFVEQAGSHIDEVESRALLMELDQITHLLERGEIDTKTARLMRESVYVMQMGTREAAE